MDTILRLLNYLGSKVAGSRVWVGTATTDANGDWTIDYTTANFAAPPFVLAVPVLNTATVQDMVGQSALRSRSATEASGTALRGANLLALGVTVRRAPAGTEVMVAAVGSISP